MEENKLENKEKLENLVTVVFVRHGDTNYLENTIPKDKKIEIKKSGKRDIYDLTEAGVEKILGATDNIFKLLNVDKDLIAFLGSPAWRAQDSENIIKEKLSTFTVVRDGKETKFNIFKDKEVGFLKYATHHDNDYMVEYWEKAKKQGKSTDLIYAYDEDLQKQTDKLEVASETRKRTESFLQYIQVVTEKIANKKIGLEEGKRLVFISVSHFEILNPIIHDIFGVDLKKGDEDLIKKGEIVTLDFIYNEKTKQIKITAQFRGVKKENILFDRINKKFILENK